MGDINNSETVQITGTIMVVAIIVLFLVIVFVLFLHVYAKLFWLRVGEPPAGAPPGRRRRRHAFDFAPGQEPVQRGLDPCLLRSLPVVIVQSQEELKECSVCLSEIVQGERARVLPKCKHGFHVGCIDMWFHSHSTCPLCRTPVSPQPTSSVSASNDQQLTVSSNFPTNMLGVSTSSSSSSSSNTHQLPSASSSSTNALLIEVPPQISDSFGEDESKSPPPTRLRSLKRLLSREWDRRMLPSSSTNSADEV